jgi:uncharacterized protein (UPF0333 family)
MPVLTRTNVNHTPTADAKPALARKSRRGATLMEYLMMISLIVVVCLVGIGYVGTSNSGNMNASSTAIGKALKKGS